MRYETMIETLENQLEDTGGNADTVLAATVQAISETAWQEADDFRAQLPKKLAKTEPAGPNQQRTLDEFVSRIGELSGTADMAQAREYAQAGFTVISDAITAGQLRQLTEALPEEYGSLAPEVSGLRAPQCESVLASPWVVECGVAAGWLIRALPLVTQVACVSSAVRRHAVAG